MPKQPDGISKPIPIPNDGEMWFMDPETLTPYANNPRDNKDAIVVVRESIERFGYRSPIEIDADDEIVAGHTRREAAIGEGAQVVTVIKWTKMRGAESRAYRIAHNKTGERALWDDKKLIEELEAIFETNELNDMLAVPLPGDTDKSGITHTTEIECPKCRHKWRP